MQSLNITIITSVGVKCLMIILMFPNVLKSGLCVFKKTYKKITHTICFRWWWCGICHWRTSGKRCGFHCWWWACRCWTCRWRPISRPVWLALVCMGRHGIHWWRCHTCRETKTVICHDFLYSVYNELITLHTKCEKFVRFLWHENWKTFKLKGLNQWLCSSFLLFNKWLINQKPV